MYYRLRNAVTRKQVGTMFQTNGFIEGYNIHGPNSRVRLEPDEFPNFVPDLRFGLIEKAKLTDVVHASNMSAKGFLINEKVKKIFDQCLLPEHRYYDASLLDREGNNLPYYWLYLKSNDYQMVDFEKSVFRKTPRVVKNFLIKNDPIYSVKNFDEYEKVHYGSTIEDDYVILDILKIRNTMNYDMLHFYKLSTTDIYISEKLATLLKKEKVTGIDIIEDPDVVEIE